MHVDWDILNSISPFAISVDGDVDFETARTASSQRRLLQPGPRRPLPADPGLAIPADGRRARSPATTTRAGTTRCRARCRTRPAGSRPDLPTIGIARLPRRGPPQPSRRGCPCQDHASHRTVSYVHGYDERESERLHDQAGTLVELLHADTAYPAGSRVLEAGCGVGAQTVTLAAQQPGRALHVDRRLGRVARGRGARVASVAQRRVPPGRHLRPAVRAGVVRPRLRLLRARAPAAARSTALRAAAGRAAARAARSR